MDWDNFFKRTLDASGLKSYAQLAPKLGISDGAISHYRTGKRIPQVWVVAECLKVQRHPSPEKAAIEIMKAAALTSPERAFWKRLAATSAVLMLCMAANVDADANQIDAVLSAAAASKTLNNQGYNYTLCEVGRTRRADRLQ